MKRSAFGRRVKGLDSFDATCFRVCAYHFSDFDYFRFPEIYDTIQKEDVTAFLKETVRAERRVDFENTFKHYHNQKCQNSECGKHTRNTARKLEYRSPYARTEA